MSGMDVWSRARLRRDLLDVTVELTYRCNLDCFYCYNDRGKRGRTLSLGQYRALFEDLARMQTMFVMLTGGEPMVHPHFFEIGRITRELGFVVRVRTNGHTLNARNVGRLLNEVEPYVVEVTLHGASAEVHDRQTRVAGSFHRLVRHLRGARAAGLRCGLVVTPTAWNEHEIEPMVVLADELGMPLRFQGPVGPRDNGDVAPLSIQPAQATWTLVERVVAERREAAQQGRGRAEVSADSGDEVPATCSVGLTGLHVDPFGSVQACVHLQESAGNLHEQSIEEIWRHSPLFARARQGAIEAAERLAGGAPRQLGAPLFCLAVEENCNMGGARCRCQ